MAIAGLVLGILAALICWVPLIGLVSLPLAALAVLCGGIGLGVALGGKRPGVAAAASGIGLGLTAAVAACTITYVTAKSVSQAMADRPKVAPPAINPPPLPKAGELPAPPKAAAPPKADPEWVIAPNPASANDVRVSVVSAGVAKVPLTRFGEEHESANPQLILVLEIANASGTQKIDYQGWSSQTFSIPGRVAVLEDELGNHYKQVSFGFGIEVKGQNKSDSIYPRRSISDVLVFEPPVDGAEFIRLTLPGRQVGLTGSEFRIAVPTSQVRRQ